jgi:hypothetical protein
VIGRIVRVAGRLEAGVEIGGILLIGQRRVEIAAAAEPGLARGEEAGVHVHGGHMRIGHVRHQADPGGGEFRVFRIGAIDGAGKFRAERAVHGGDVDPTFSNTLPFIKPCTPPPPFSTGSPPCSRCHGV